MASLIQGYGYDIFISYRQKDNKYDGWVTEFVDNLKRELETTFKEEISVYFDINPHDGLLETHDVDASLKDKLKCLVFIPIISRTYCDPKSFAWEHEFRAFVEQASRDQFGLKVRLPDGNVASRVLPVRIYDLADVDIKLCESVLGEALHGVDFIYKSAGVNRPLRSKEEKPQDNQNNTIYRDQINKVANAINEIFCGLEIVQTRPMEKLEERHKGKAFKVKKKRIIYSLGSLFVVLAIVALFVFTSGSTLPFSKRDWIVITDFENLTDDPVFDKSLYTAFSLSTSQSRYINVYPRSRMFETLARMQIKDQVFIDEKTGREIAIREGINIYIVPSISVVGDRYAITAKILETSSGDLLNSEILYAGIRDEILPALDKLSKKIRKNLGESRYNISVQDKPLKIVTTSSLEALKLYSQGIDQHYRLDFKGARDYYENALKIDSGFTAAKASLGTIILERFRDKEKGRMLLEGAVKSADNLTDREKYTIIAFHALKIENDINKGIDNVRMLVKLYPDDPGIHHNLGYYYHVAGQYEDALKEYKKAVQINPAQALSYTGILWIYLEKIGSVDSLLIWSDKMISDNPQNAWGYMYQGTAWFMMDSLKKAEAAFIKSREINPYLTLNLYALGHTYRLMERYDEAINILKKILEINRNEFSAYYEMGNIFLLMGKPEEARENFSTFRKNYSETYLKTEPDNAVTYTSLAAVSAKLGDMDSSRQMLQKAVEIDSTLHQSFAKVLYVQGRVPEAINELAKALASGYRDLYRLKSSADLRPLQFDIRFRELIDKYFK